MINSTPIKITFFVGAIALVTGCATPKDSLTPKESGERGAAVREAYAKQIVNPNATPGAPIIHSDKVNAAVERYLNDEVKKPTETKNIELADEE